MPTMRDSLVDLGHNMPSGPFGTCINGQTFQQEALITRGGWQYAAYFGRGGRLGVARRRLPDGAWQPLLFDDYAIAHDDVHNTASLGIAADGVIHLAFDHHVHPLHYRRSRAGLAADPDHADWSTAAFTATTDALIPGQPLAGVTYPVLFAAPGGRLQLLYRLGSSGDGDWHLAEYDPAAGAWSRLGMLLSGRGPWRDSTSRCAYPNPLRYDRGGRLHLTWCWRERPADGIRDLRTNHDHCYAWSDDRGRTWHGDDGSLVAALAAGRPITVDTAACLVRTTPYRWGQMNTTTQAVDAAGRVHLIDWRNPEEAAAGSTDLHTWRHHHHVRAADGGWSSRRLPLLGRKPQLLVDDAGTAWVVCQQPENRNYHGSDPGGRLVLWTAAAPWADWHEAWSAPFAVVGEPLVDPDRWRDEGILSVYVQERPSAPGEPSPLHVLDLDPRQVRG